MFDFTRSTVIFFTRASRHCQGEEFGMGLGPDSFSEPHCLPPPREFLKPHCARLVAENENYVDADRKWAMSRLTRTAPPESAIGPWCGSTFLVSLGFNAASILVYGPWLPWPSACTSRGRAGAGRLRRSRPTRSRPRVGHRFGSRECGCIRGPHQRRRVPAFHRREGRRRLRRATCVAP